MFVLISAASTMFNACKKDKYQPKGDYQPAGNYGNANITSSTTVTINNWSSAFDDGVNFEFEASVSWAAITQAIKDKGMVAAYMDDGSGNWVALPTAYADDTYSSITISFHFNVGIVKFYLTGFDDSGSPLPSDFNGMVVRIVAISSAGLTANPNLDYKNYYEVKKVFGLKD